MKEITPIELKKMLDEKANVQVIDVREPYEVDICNIGAENIPMGDVVDNLDKIRRDIPVIIHCRSGGRSGAVVQALGQRHGFTNLINLTGGMLAWIDQVNPALSTY